MQHLCLHIISRETAKTLLINVYFTGVKCRNGHVSTRYCSNTCCVSCKSISDRKQYLEKADEIKGRANKWYAENKERRIEKNKAWLAANPGAASARYKIWSSVNRDRINSIERNRRARKKGAGGAHTASDIEKIYIMQKGRCANCKLKINQGKRSSYHVDHVMPISLGGGNDRGNLQILCPGCNLEKRAKHPGVWAKENGRLL